MQGRMRLARRAFIAGSIGFVFIGGLHTVVHLIDLAGPELEARFQRLGTIDVSGESVRSWDLFQGISLLMGLFSMTIGLIDLGALRSTGPDQLPPVPVAVANITMLMAIIAVGAAYLGPLQVYGGLFGIACFGVGPATVASNRWFAPRLAAS